MVPKGWTLLQVSDICKLQNGNSFKPHEWDTQGLPIIRIQNLNGSDNYNYFSGVPQDKWLVEPGQLLFSWAGTKGVSFGPFIWNGPKGVLNQHIYKVFANENVHGHWLYLALLHITQKIEAQAHGFKSTLLHVQKKDIDNQFVLTPPVAEQKKIAQILSTWDKAISVTETLLANSKQQKKALMQQLLTGKKRLLDENGVRFIKKWKKTTLGDIAKITTGSSNRQDSTLDGKYTFFDRSEDIRTSSIYLFDGEAIIVPGEGQRFEPKYFIGKFDLHQRTYAIMDFASHSGRFLFYMIDYLKVYFLNQAVGSTVKSLRLPMFQKMTFEAPEIEEQQKIAAVLSAADAEISTLEKKLACLKGEKKALMQQLLTGKRRVVVDVDAA
ncbi:restriction endonuclease subunit S [Escherichia coli]|nr:restriction endonuclease subunit S [Escherichia coli]EFI1480027.1 restriction endonuclease subunit S [Escherichia coli]EIQ0791548.1 restriction endonuclease subunit S [Escherichia coli]EIQ2010683.1 restriction endonuclease subunit S [Escherichia coli]EJH1094584.1 restriction endonuclease subunit S [Escherichia coli]